MVNNVNTVQVERKHDPKLLN